MTLFDVEREQPLRRAIDFYQHARDWSNRLVAGGSLLVMNSLLEKEVLAGRIQMVYLDPPYGIRYGSNFQPFVNRREVFGSGNFVSLIYFATTGGFSTETLSRIGDYIVWYAKDRPMLKYRQLYTEKALREGGGWTHTRAEFEDGMRRNIGVDQVRRKLAEGEKLRPYSLDGIASQSSTRCQVPPDYRHIFLNS